GANRGGGGGARSGGFGVRRESERGPPRAPRQLGRAAHRRQQLLQPQVPDAGSAAASGRQPEPERRPGGQRRSGPGAARELRVLDRLPAAVLAGGLQRPAADAGGEPAAARGRRGEERAGANLSARVPPSRHRHHPRVAGGGRPQSLVLQPAPAGLERPAMTAALLLSLLAAAPAPDWFRAFQYAQKPAALRGCSECQGEPDDLCEVRAGTQSRPLDEYRRERPEQPDRVKLLRARADPGCAVRAGTLFGPKGAVELAAIRVARVPPSAALIEKLEIRQAIAGWPRAPIRRKGVQPAAAPPDRAQLRLALVCWGSERGWPSADLGRSTSCEWWLLPFRADGEADESRASFAVLARPQGWPELFRFGDPRWPRAFDPASTLDESILLGEEPKPPEPPAPVAAPAPPRREDVRCAALEQQLGCSIAQEGHCLGAGREGRQ